MKQKLQSSSHSTSSRVDSPLASYDSEGNLSCRVCVSRLRENQWTSHLLSRDHRNRLESLKITAQKGKEAALKRKESESSQIQEPEPLTPCPVRVKEASDDQIPSKRIKHEDSEKIGISKRELIAKLEEEINEEVMVVDMTQDDDEDDQQEVQDTSNLPPGFFDDASKKTSSLPEEASTSTLPPGFFDDPQADAKARSVAFVDPLDEEYAQFQKLISSENNRSEIMVQEDLEYVQQEKTTEEIEEQMDKWKRIDRLEQQLEEKMKQGFVRLPSSSSSEEKADYDHDDSGEEDDDKLSCLLDWRRKGGFK